MKVKVSEASGPVLDWMVAKCEDIHTGYPGFWSNSVIESAEGETDNPFAYSTNWNLAGPIIEREKIELRRDIMDETWHAQPHDMDSIYQRKAGPTPLIAAMRCYVASKLGEEVEVPDELTP